MVDCPRCGRTVDELHSVSPDAISKQLLDSTEHGAADLAGEGEVEVCADCLDELTGD